MSAIFKREMRAYATNIIGCVFLAVSIAVMGIFVLVTNILTTVPQIEYGLLGSVMALIITIPLLCVNTFSQENKTGHIRLLLSLPVSSQGIVFGKFFAAVTMLAIPTALMAIIPLILSAFGGVIMSASYISILGYFLIGAASVSVCIFISAQTRRAWVSLSVGIFTLLLLYVSPTLSGYLPAFGVTLFLEKIIRFVSPFERFSVFTQGIFKIADVVYLLSFTALFVLLTCRTVDLKRWDARITSQDSKQARARQVAAKGRPIIITAVSIVILLAINIGVCAIPAGLTTVDASGYGMYTISQNSADFVGSLDEDVAIYLLSERGIPDEQINALLVEYAEYSKHIDYKVIDVTANPEFLEKYAGIAYNQTNDDGNSPVNNHSIVIESSKRNIIIDSSRFYHYRVSSTSYTETEFRHFLEQAAQQGYDVSTIKYSTYFDLDKLVISGIEYVTLEHVDTVFTLIGHGEKPLTERFYENLTYASVIYENMCLDDYDEIPDYCTALIIVSPETDISGADASKIISYMKKGGDVILITSEASATMENLMSVTHEYGLVAVAGTIHDTDPKYHTNEDQTDLILQTNAGHGIVSYIKSQYDSTDISSQPRFPNSHPIVKTSGAGGVITITEMLATSERAALVVDGSVIAEDKTYFVGYDAKKTIDEATANESHLIWYSSYDAFTSKYMISNPINHIYLLMSVSYVGAADEFETSLTIDSCNISGSFLKLDRSQPALWGIGTGVVTLLILGAGITVYALRRTRKKA